jgi:hypothetical protein
MVRGAEQANENHLLLRQSKISIPKAGREILVGGYNVRKCLNGHSSSRERIRNLKRGPGAVQMENTAESWLNCKCILLVHCNACDNIPSKSGDTYYEEAQFYDIRIR